ncbi:MAG TPA: amidohydrolase, partial [Chthonomonadales bacterium]|nr:amidohydrolase [Chthonomonadales bacterium]
ALAIERGRIVAVGKEEEILPLAGTGTRVFNLQGHTLVPGFNDCHMHILPYGLDLAQADLSPAAGVTNVPQLIAALRQWADSNPHSEWILGSRYDQNIFPGAAHPTRTDLDAAISDRPVYIVQTSKHAGVANSAALKLAGISRNTPDPKGGQIVRNADGEPTGVLLESAMSLVARHIPKPHKAGMIDAIRQANKALVRVGITAASDLNTGWLDLEAEIAAYRQAAEEGMPVRMTLCPHAPKCGAPKDIPDRAAFAADFGLDEARQSRIRLGPLKLFSDGALTVRTAALREPYADGSGSGMLLHEPEVLQDYILAGHQRGWQMAVHAIGDRAIEQVLDCYAKASILTSNPSPSQGEGYRGWGGRASRHRIEHAMLLDGPLIQRFAEQQVIPVVQPEFLARLGDAYVLGLGPERAARINPTASLQRAGVGVAFSSDCPIVPGAPLEGIRAAARRTTRSGQVLGPEECICPLDGLRNYTYWAAYSTFDEGEVGTIEPGKRADLTILDFGFPIWECGLTIEVLDAVRVVATIIAGKTVYGEEELG